MNGTKEINDILDEQILFWKLLKQDCSNKNFKQTILDTLADKTKSHKSDLIFINFLEMSKILSDEN